MAMYLAISLVLTGMVPYNGCVDPSEAAGQCRQMILASDAPVSAVFAARNLHWVSGVINIAAVAGIASVVFAFMLGAARIWFALARDGLLPGWFAKSHPKYGTPYRPTLMLGGFTALSAGLLPIRELAELVNIGTLSAFIVICSSVLFLLIGRPWVTAGRFHMIGGLDIVTMSRFVIWMAIGLAIYFFYGIRHSKLATAGKS